MRRLVLSIIAACGLVTVFPGSASAEPTSPADAAAPAAGAAPVAGKKVCRATDSKLTELSGLVAVKDGFIAVNDGSLNQRGMRVFYLSTACRMVKQVSYSGDGPRDPEDLVLSPDGKTLWIADVGDKNKDRKTIGLWKMPADGSKSPVLYRLSYPQGDGPYDAEALLLNGDGTPIIVTKALTRALVFVPTAELKANRATGVPMRRAAEIVVPPSTTPTGLPYGRGVITGGAVAPGGDRVALRTYSDALEWDVTDGDVIGALKGRARVTPLPDERQGEALAYTADGKAFLTVNDLQGVSDEDVPNDILQYTPALPAPAAVAASGGTSASDTAADTRAWFDKLSLNDITYLVGGVGVVGAILVGAGIFGIVRARRRPPVLDRKAAASAAGAEPPDVLDAVTELLEAPDRGPGRPVGVGVRPRSAVYGGGRPVAGVGAGAGTGANGRPGGPRVNGQPAVQGVNGQGVNGQGANGRPSGGPAPAAAPGVYGAPAAPAPAPASALQKGSGVYGGVASGGQAANGRPGKGSVYGAQPARPQGAPAGLPPAVVPGRTPAGAPSRPSQVPAGQQQGPGAPQGRPQGAPQGRPQGAPQGRPQGAPQGRPQGAPQGRPQGAPQGAPQGTPQGRPQGAPHGRPQGAPQGRPQGAPQGAPVGRAQGAAARPQGGSGGRPPGAAQAPAAPGRQQSPAQGRSPGAAPQGGAQQRPAGQPQGTPPARPAPAGRPGGGSSGRPSGFFGQDPNRRGAGQPSAGRQPDHDAGHGQQPGHGRPGQDGQRGTGSQGQRGSGPQSQSSAGQSSTGQSSTGRADAGRRPSSYVPHGGEESAYGSADARGDR